jgi:F-type H+-transporting ATPase subunit delta
MTPGAVGKRYARALFELAAEGGVVEGVGEELGSLAEAIRELEPGTLSAGALSVPQRARLAAAMAKRIGAESVLGRFVAVLAQNDRLEQLPAVQAAFEAMQDRAAGRIRVRVRAASELSDAERTAVRQRFEALSGRAVLDSVEIDEGLVGGLTVEAEGRVHDGSIRTQLARLERRMAGQG